VSPPDGDGVWGSPENFWIYCVKMACFAAFLAQF